MLLTSKWKLTTTLRQCMDKNLKLVTRCLNQKSQSYFEFLLLQTLTESLMWLIKNGHSGINFHNLEYLISPYHTNKILRSISELGGKLLKEVRFFFSSGGFIVSWLCNDFLPAFLERFAPVFMMCPFKVQVYNL